jgi:hypothetical protein
MSRPALRTILSCTVALGIAAAGAASAAPAGNGHGGGHGAVKAALIPTTSTSPAQCDKASSGAAAGFAVLNAPGKPTASPSKILGTVALKGAPEHNTAFKVELAIGGSCQDTGVTLTTNAVGNGTASFNVPVSGGTPTTTYYVVLTKPLIAQLPLPLQAEAYATPSVTLS